MTHSTGSVSLQEINDVHNTEIILMIHNTGSVSLQEINDVHNTEINDT